MQAYETQLERLKLALNVESDTAFSQLLDVSQGSVSGAKRRGQIPFAWFFQVAEKTGTSIDWLYSGRSPMRPATPVDEDQPQMADVQYPEKIEQNTCPRCVKMEKELSEEREERRELARENRQLWKENAALREENATLKATAQSPVMGDARKIA